ncbi:MAG: tRNA (adenine-N1)-methyltransferase [Actinobacteria bacterium]|nr:tRNA (adenine-N1)-methyltransferase [Actinomycetota bacterium]
MSEPFEAGEVCLLLDARSRTYLVDLRPGATFQYHAGGIPHDAIIGSPPGSVHRTTSQARLVALRPRLADYVLRMKRGPQVVYPKDLGAIVHWGDIAPGMTVLEAGTGSGALTLALLRAVGPEGKVVSVEKRPEHAAHAVAAITRFLGGLPGNLDLRDGLVEDLVGEVGPDRLVLDLPEPWHTVEAAAEGLADHGVLTTYLPTIPQVSRVRDAMRRTGRFAPPTTFEVLHREWAADGRSVRPSHQMVGHTGFITVAYKTLEEPGAPAGDEPPGPDAE